MRRRQFLKGLGAAGISAGASSSTFAQGVAGASRVQRVIVIGAGIVGASIAYNLARRGAEVIVIEKTAPAAEASPGAELAAKIKAQVRRVFLGQPEVLDQVVAAMEAAGV